MKLMNSYQLFKTHFTYSDLQNRIQGGKTWILSYKNIYRASIQKNVMEQRKKKWSFLLKWKFHSSTPL
jgi:hypothetical protein